MTKIGLPVRFASAKAPLTGVPAPLGLVGLATVTYASGWLLLSRWFALNHQEKSPLRLPISALPCFAKYVSFVAYWLKSCQLVVAFTLASNCFGIRVVMSSRRTD